MADLPNSQLWFGRTVFMLLCFLIIFFQLLPLDSRPEEWPWPDLLLVVTLVWVTRRPDFAPFFVIGTVFFVTDLMFQRPPGLWAALILIFTEILRKRSNHMRNMPLLGEWGFVVVGLAAVVLLNRLVLFIALTPMPPLGLTLLQFLMTAAFYPVIATIAHFLFGIARPAPGAVDSLGHKL